MRTVIPKVKLKRDQKVLQISPFRDFLKSLNHQSVPFRSSPPAPGVRPVHSEQAGQSSGVPLRQLNGAGAPPASAV